MLKLWQLTQVLKDLKVKLLTFGKVVLLSSLLTTFSATAQDETTTPTQDNTQTESDTGIKVEKPDAVEDLQEGDAVYVSEMANVWLRTCPSSNCRIVGATHVGDKYSFVKVSPDKKFTLVDNGQKQLWMQTRDLQIEPCGKAKVDLLEGEIANLNNRLENYDSEVAHNYQVAKAKIEKLEKENAQLKDTLAKQNSQIEELDATRRDYADKLETKELDMQMRWWLQGAIIALCGAIIGIICVYIPRPNRKKKMNRF